MSAKRVGRPWLWIVIGTPLTILLGFAAWTAHDRPITEDDTFENVLIWNAEAAVRAHILGHPVDTLRAYWKVGSGGRVVSGYPKGPVYRVEVRDSMAQGEFIVTLNSRGTPERVERIR